MQIVWELVSTTPEDDVWGKGMHCLVPSITLSGNVFPGGSPKKCGKGKVCSESLVSGMGARKVRVLYKILKSRCQIIFTLISYLISVS